MTRLKIIAGLPMTLLLIGIISYLRNVLQINPEKEKFIAIKNSNGAVADILSSMNQSVDPCDNFYNYACQGWNEKNSRPDYMSFWNEFTKLDKDVIDSVIEILEMSTHTGDIPALVEAKQFYRKCSEISDDEFDLQAMLNVLDEYGGWPILYDDGNWNDSRFHWIKSTTALKRRFSETVILNAMPHQYPYWMNITNTVVITPPTNSFGDVYGITDESTYQNVATLLIILIVRISKAFLEFQGKTNVNEAYLHEKAMDIIRVTAELSEINKHEDDTLPTFIKCLGLVQQGECGRYDMPFIQSLLDDFTFPEPNKLNITYFLQNLYQTKDSPYFNEAIVIQPDYLFQLAHHVSQVRTDEQMANFIHFRMVLKMIPLTGNKYLNGLLLDFASSVVGVRDKLDRNMSCALETKQKFFQAVGQAYVNTRGNLDTEFETIRSMYHNLKESIDILIEESSASHLNQSFLKLENNVTRLCLGYSPLMNKNDSFEMQSDQNRLLLNQSSSFLQQIMTINSWKVTESLKSIENMLPEPSEENDCVWTIFPGKVGAYNLFTQYIICIQYVCAKQKYDSFHSFRRFMLFFFKFPDLPLGMIQQPFFSTQLPLAINYGKLGSILGHEIVHGLVVPELLELKNGSLTPIAQCLVDQYDQFAMSELQRHRSLDGKLKVQEIIPDNLGLLAAYKAFKKAILFQEMGKKLEGLDEFTDDQLFFLGFAQNWCGITNTKFQRNSKQNDNHPPGIFRALGTLQNSKEFSEAWKCPVGSNMNPDPDVYQKCTL